jgi:hypothetical protein
MVVAAYANYPAEDRGKSGRQRGVAAELFDDPLPVPGYAMRVLAARPFNLPAGVIHQLTVKEHDHLVEESD